MLNFMISRWRCGFMAAAAAAFAGLLCGAAQAQQTYKIVSFLDYSGPFANRGKPVEQIQRLVVDWYNETAGAKNGVTIVFEPIDTGYDQAKTVQAYERAIQDKTVVGMVTFGSPNVLAIQNRLPESKIPAVHGGPAYSLMQKGSWVFTPLGDYARYFATAIDWRLGSWTGPEPMKVAFVTFDGSSGRDWATGLSGKMEGKKAELVLTEFISPKTLDVAVNVEHIVDAAPDMVIIATTDQLQPLLLAELKANDFDMAKVVNSQHEGLGLLAQLGVAPDVLEGSYEVTTENYIDTTTEAFKIYESRKDNYQTRWAADTLLHYPSMMVLLDALDRAVVKKSGAKITGEDVFSELSNGTFDGRGLLGTISFDNANDPTRGADSAVILQHRGGKIEAVTDFLPLAE